jgi:hypothetical protein
MEQYRLFPELAQQHVRGFFNRVPIHLESLHDILFAQGSCAEVVLERLGRDRALHALALDKSGKHEHEIASAILRGFLRESNLRNRHMKSPSKPDSMTID